MAGQDLAFRQAEDAECIDIAIEDGDFAAEDGLETAVLISLFSDRYVPADELPVGLEDPGGWWADSVDPGNIDRIGSRLWIYDRIGKLDLATRNGMKDAVEEALVWMVRDGIASRIVVNTILVQSVRIDLSVQIFRPGLEGGSSFDFLWDAQGLKIAG